ncbi:hypothetical protein JY651_42665 [Pyxidicoccus parkwayensis]|uniref:Uncharacterized protein n=1 Tax=Pyxidicoccus parkwayensis TaxID=2813578 RepID=A0ABX7P0F4_9BACT|nr:DUF5682 family protein [Pyxidicoccus parkwaysis]QSQ21788.1 hypothetical protein JY651_42665 [Pyxidicoccus parkwaysis]
MDLALLSRVHLFSVRHHSPRTTSVLGKWLERVRPEVILVEGPCDATGIVDVLCDEATKPPVAILGYRTDGTPRSALWPFAEYSPEYAALRWAKANKARAEFIDIPVGVSLEVDREEDGEEPGVESDDTESAAIALPEEPLTERFAKERGYRSFEELWEAMFEAPDWTPEGFRPVLLAWADVLNAGPRHGYHRWRDAFMARKVLEVVASGVPPEKVAVVAGAAHVAAFVAGDVEPALEAKLPKGVPCAVTLIPYSFPRLAEQLGYGAGNRAPHFYQKAHEAKCDFRRATLEVLIDFAGHLRTRGFTASLSDVLEAYRLALTLADLREKSAPGLDELREATVATLCRGDATHVDGFLWKSVIGHQVGRVASRIGQNSLQAEFWREVDARRLPRSDSPETFSLRLNNDVEVGSSVFLHRLRVTDIPYASLQGAGQQRNAQPQEAGGYAALTRVRESWQAQWTPSTDVALVEKIVLGDTLEAVTTRVLQERLNTAKSTADAADVLLESVITGCSQTVASALRACDAHAATDSDLPSLASAARALSGLVAYGTSRAHADVGDEAVAVLCEKTFGRALLRVREASACAPDAVGPVLEALRTLHEVALAQPRADKAGWLAEARGLMESHAVHPSTSGLATGLLYIAQELSETDVALEVGRRLSLAVEPEAGAAYLEGFLQVNALVLVKSREVVKALDDFLSSVEPERFRQTLPVLRRALGALGSTERRYLMENVVALRQLGTKGQAVKTVLEEKDKEKLKDMSAELGKALDDLDDLL